MHGFLFGENSYFKKTCTDDSVKRALSLKEAALVSSALLLFPVSLRNSVFSFARAVTTKDDRLGGLNNGKLSSHWSGH